MRPHERRGERAFGDGAAHGHGNHPGAPDGGGQLHQPVEELSGGQRRRVAIARAVCFGGGLLLLDEPFKGLDAETRQQAAAYILRHRNGAAVVCATHDREDAAALGAEIVAL